MINDNTKNNELHVQQILGNAQWFYEQIKFSNDTLSETIESFLDAEIFLEKNKEETKFRYAVYKDKNRIYSNDYALDNPKPTILKINFILHKELNRLLNLLSNKAKEVEPEISIVDSPTNNEEIIDIDTKVVDDSSNSLE